MQFEHHASLSCIKHTCQFKNCNRSYSDLKTLIKHKRHCKHFEEAMSESKIYKKYTQKKIENVCNEIKVQSEIYKKKELSLEK